MKKMIFILIIFCVYLTACTKTSYDITASGTIETDEYDVFSQVSGKIIEVKKGEGDNIDAGETIIMIDSADAQSNIKQAEANVRIAQAKLDSILAGTRFEQISQARATLNAAQANLDDLKAGSRPEQIKAAEAIAAQTKANLDGLKSGNRTQQIEQAKYQVSQTEITFANAQKNYDYQLQNLADVETLYNSGVSSKSEKDKAQLQTDSALSQLNTAKEQVNIAKSQLDLLASGATSEAIAAAQAQYDQAQSNVDLLRKGATKQSIAAAQAGVDQAQAALDYLLNGYSKQEIEQAEANLDVAKASLELAENQLTKYQVKSPISGIMLYKNMDIGQVVNPGSNVFTVEATDNYWIKIYIPQKYNGKVAVTDKVKITASNLANETIQGTVTWISPRAEFTPKNIETVEAKQENTVFAIKVRIDDHLESLRPGMNAVVTLGE